MVRNIQWKLERFIVFQTVILQQARRVTTYQSIRRQIEKRLDVREAARHGMLLEDTLRTRGQYLIAAHREESEEHRGQNFHSLVLRGKLRTAVRWIMERETGGAYFRPRRGAQIWGR